ncbi:MAG: hypothetical protein LBS85_04295, partial [Clostridiales Family XIII bacterium]|nr:hypothetical protein [Clostridiales Family XIII bacterium]
RIEGASVYGRGAVADYSLGYDTWVVAVNDTMYDGAGSYSFQFRIASEMQETTVSVRDENGQYLNDGYEVLWYKGEGEEPIQSGNTIEREIGETYAYEIKLSEALGEIYRTPLRQQAGEEESIEYRLVRKADVSHVLTIEANIDGTSELVFQNGAVWWEHFASAAPGRHDGLDEPTILNGYEWLPWEGQTGELRNGAVSAALPLSMIGLNLGGEWAILGMSVIEGRGSVALRSSPAPENEYTGRLLFRDDASADAWDKVEI